MTTTNSYQICNKLVLDTSYPGISFDAAGVCNLYHDFYHNVKPHWHSGSEGRHQLEATVDAIRNSGKGRDFDCIMGLSGGADSSYMLHVMVTEFGLRPLVFHVDGGWNSEIAVHNINGLIDRLGLDLYTEVINWEEMRDFQLAMFKSGVPHIDTPQDLAFIGVLYKFARKHGIKYILNGGNISTECVPRPLDIIYWGTDMMQIRDILARFGTVSMRTYPFSSVFYHKFYLRYLRGIKVFKPLNYMPYVKQQAMDTMQREYGWKPYPQKHFESRFTRFFEGYWLPTRFAFDMRRVDLSSLILTDQLSRDQALQELERPPYDPELIQQDFDYIATKLGISSETLRGYLEMPLKSYRDYRNQHRIFELGEWVLSRLAGTRRGGAF
ncbi:MAG: N-acetyl sugar amidotransferase [Gammaproteobacteria bacterium]|nr:N-acetyl sugar amidotransferase [Gammaproteobacteria bacterium]